MTGEQTPPATEAAPMTQDVSHRISIEIERTDKNQGGALVCFGSCHGGCALVVHRNGVSACGQVARHLVASPGYLAANGTPLQLSELAGHACLVHGSLPVWPLQEGGWRPQGACVSNSLLALRELALHEGGIALLPHHVCQEDLATGRLQKLLPDHPIPPNPFYLIYPSREHLAPALRSLMDFVAERLPFA